MSRLTVFYVDREISEKSRLQISKLFGPNFEKYFRVAPNIDSNACQTLLDQVDKHSSLVQLLVSGKFHNRSPIDHLAILEARAQGKTYAQIGELLGVTKAAGDRRLGQAFFLIRRAVYLSGLIKDASDLSGLVADHIGVLPDATINRIAKVIGVATWAELADTLEGRREILLSRYFLVLKGYFTDIAESLVADGQTPGPIITRLSPGRDMK